MLSLGALQGGRVRLHSAGALCVPRRTRSGLLPALLPLRRRLLLEARRTGRSPADADGANQPDQSGARGAPDPASTLEYWEQQVAEMPFRDMQAALRGRNLSSGGKKDEVAARLAAVLLEEHTAGSSADEEEEFEEEEPEQQAGTAAAAAAEEEDEEDMAARVEAMLEVLEEVSYADLKRMCAERGLSSAGKKPDLQNRLAEAMVEAGEDLEALEEAEEQQAADRAAAAADQEEYEEQDEEAEYEEQEEGAAGGSVPAADRASVLAEFMRCSVAELTAELRKYGAPTSGTKAQLAERVTDLVLAELAESGADEAAEDEEGEYYEDEEEDEEYEEREYEEGEEEEEAAPARPAARTLDPVSLSASDRALLLSDAIGRARQENEKKTRAALYQDLRALNPRGNVSFGTKPVLLDKLSRVLGEQRVEAEIEAATQDAAAAANLQRRLGNLRRYGTAEPPQDEEEEEAGAGAAEEEGPEGAAGLSGGVIDYDQLTWLDVRRMKAEDLRAALAHFGLKTQGNKYELIERIRHLVPARRPGRPTAEEPAAEAAAAAPSTASPAEAITRAVVGMGLRQVREELETRGLDTSGPRAELDARLVAAMKREAEAARRVSSEVKEAAAAAAAAEEAEATAGAEEAGPEALAERLLELSRLPLEARAAAVISHLARSPESLNTLGREAPVDVAVVAGCPPGRLDLAQQSLDAARALLDHLYTAHMPSLVDPPPPPPPSEEEAAAAPSPAALAAAYAASPSGDVPAATAEPAAGTLPYDPVVDTTLSATAAPGAVPRPASGVVVSVWWLDGTTGLATRLSPAQVYGATAVELAAGCLPAVHRDLLPVPPPSPLSLDTPELEAPVPPAEVEAAGEAFADMASLAAHLRGSAHVVFPAVPAASPLYGALQRALEEAGVPHVGCGAEAAGLTADRLGVLQRLESLNYPVVPHMELTPAAVAEAVLGAAAEQALEAEAQEAEEAGGEAEEEEAEEEEKEDPVLAAAQAAVQERVIAWCKEKGLNPDRQLFVLRPRTSTAPLLAETATALGAARVAQTLAPALAQAALGAAGGAESEELSVVVEVAPPASAARFVCTVVETPDGPVALLPSEVELYDTEMAILRHVADVKEWQGLREGLDEEELQELRAQLMAVELEPWRTVYDPRAPTTLPFTTSARLHTPPRLSRKLTHAVRHAAARLFSELGLRDAAMVEGWVELPEGYAERVDLAAKAGDEGAVPILEDDDPNIVQMLEERQEAIDARDPAPLKDYYDFGSSWHADLSLFDPQLRLLGDRNGEGATVRLAAVAADLPLDPRHPAVMQAAELGLPHGALLRNLANNALRRAAEAGDRRAQVPGEPYVSPEAAVEAARLAAMQGGQEGLVDEDGEELVLEVEGRKEVLTDEEEAARAAAAEAAAAAAAAAVEVGPQALQLPMPPQLPLYHTALMQHVKEADMYDEWVETNDPDHWDEGLAADRVQRVHEAFMEEIEDDAGLPLPRYDSPNPDGEELLGAMVLEQSEQALDAAVEALGDFGKALGKAMRLMPRDVAIEEDAEICLTRTADLPPPDAVLPDGKDGTLEDPRVAASLQVAGIVEIARRNGWEVLEVESAEEGLEARKAWEEEAEREGAVKLSPAEERTAALEEQLVLEAMCESEDEVMELRTGMIAPVQLYLRFRSRQARAEPASHPLELAVLSSANSAILDEPSDEIEAEADAAVDQDDPEAFTIDGVYLQDPEDAPAGSFGPFGPASTGTGDSAPNVYSFDIPGDDQSELPANESAALLAEDLIERRARGGKDGGLAAEVGSTARDKLVLSEWEALALMDMRYSVEQVGVNEEGEPILGAVGPDVEGLLTDTVVGAFGGGVAELPAFASLAAILEDEGLPTDAASAAAAEAAGTAAAPAAVARAASGRVPLPIAAAADEDDDEDAEEAAPASSSKRGYDETLDVAGVGMDWDDEDAFERGVSRSVGAGGGDEEDDEDAAWLGDEEVFDFPPNSAFTSPDPETTVEAVREEVEAALARGDRQAAELAAMAVPLNPRRVWVVVGGDGYWAREQGLVAGANVIAKLSKFQDIVVEPFLMVPLGEGRSQERAREELLRRRTEAVAGVGMDPDDDLSPYMDLQLLRSTPPAHTGRPETQSIYAVTLATVSRPTVGEALASLERTMQREGVAPHGLSEVQRQQRAAHVDVQAELAASGMEGIASLYDDDITGRAGPPPARPLDLATFAEEAAREGAVVLMTARGDMAQSGILQRLLELEGVPFVGPGADQMSSLWDRLNTQELLEDLHDKGVDTPPRFVLTWDQIETVAELDEMEAEASFRSLRAQVMAEEAAAAAPSASVLARPLIDGAGCGLARLSNGADLAAYAVALVRRAAVLPADTLFRPHPAINLPALPPARIAFEPFVETDPLLLVVSSPSSSSTEVPSAPAAEGTPSGSDSEEQEEGRKTPAGRRRKGAKKASAAAEDEVVEKKEEPEVAAAAAAGGPSTALMCSRDKGWLEVSFALVGPLGGTSCLPLAMRAAVLGEGDLEAALAADAAYAAQLEAAEEEAAEVLGTAYMEERAAARAEDTASGAADAKKTKKVDEEVEEAWQEMDAAAGAILQEAAERDAAQAVGPPPHALAGLLAHSPRTWVVPPPEDALSAEAAAAACRRAQLVADRLALRGLVQIEAFVSADTGDLVVYDINTHPDLGPDSPIYRQAAAAGMLPQDLLRTAIGLALQARAQPDAEQATFNHRIGALTEAEWALDDFGGYDDEEDGDEDDEDVDGEGGRSALADRDAEDEEMLGELEELRAGAVAEDDEEAEGGYEEAGRGRAGAGRGDEEGYDAEEEGGAGSLYFEDDDAGQGSAAGQGYMGLSEFGGSGRGRRGGRAMRDDFDFDDADF